MKHINRLLVLACLLAGGLPARGQVDLTPEEPLTRPALPTQKSIRVRGFGTVVNELSFVNGGPVLSSGGGGAVLLNRRFWLGAYGLATVTPVRNVVYDPRVPTAEQFAGFTEASGWIGYSFRPRRAIHVAISTRVGAGYWDLGDTVEPAPATWVLHPRVDVELNLFRWLRGSLGLGYRYVPTNSELTRSYTFNSPTLAIGLSLGWFD